MLHCHGVIIEHVSACYNHNGGMGVKHQVIYLKLIRKLLQWHTPVIQIFKHPDIQGLMGRLQGTFHRSI